MQSLALDGFAMEAAALANAWEVYAVDDELAARAKNRRPASGKSAA
jgi:hypothetical protein